jgi:membrane fusion protein (multidrug efflux system)
MTPTEDPTTEKSGSQAPRRRKQRIGRFMLFAGPLLVGLACAYLYLTSGRFISTDNAYIQADKVAISSQVAGAITEIKVTENSHVEQGQPLFALDDRTYAITLEQARARLQGVKADIAMLKASAHQKLNELKLAQVNSEFAEREYQRQSNLDKFKAVAEAKLDDAKHNLEVSRQQIGIVHDQMAQILARLDGDPEADVERQASYRLAKAEVEQAELNLARCVVRAPFAGMVSKVPNVGQYVDTGKAIMSLIADSSFWIEANFKETELTHVHSGQTAEIEVDTYPDQKWQGTVTTISPGTGSEYSIIPAQNATGNWVKVVQRIPVRITVSTDPNGPNLLAGMSTVVRIDTGYSRPLPSLVQRVFKAAGFPHNAWAN